MVVNVLNFLFWLLNFVRYLVYTYLFLWPLAVLKSLKELLLFPLSPVFSTCAPVGCRVNDAGWSTLVALVLLLLVVFLKWQGSKQKRNK